MVDDCSLAHGGVQPNKAQTGSHHLLMGHAYGDDIGLAEQMETTAAGGGIGGGGGAGAASVAWWWCFRPDEAQPYVQAAVDDTASSKL
jgi:hypothetical protein